MKNFLYLFILAGGLFFYSCDVDQTQEGALPDVNVDVDAGALPAFDVEWADVNVGTRTETVTVPTVKVVMEEVEVEVPYVDVDMPNEGEKEEMTIVAEAELVGEAADIKIEEIYATDRRLIVISTLKKNGTDLGDENMRVSDRIVLNAPDLDVKHYIIGERHNRSFNKQYSYISSRSAIADKLKNGRTIWKK